MAVIGNILWLLLGGLWLALGYAAAGLIAFVLIITIPFGRPGVQAGRLHPLAFRASHGAPPRRGCRDCRPWGTSSGWSWPASGWPWAT